MSSMNELGVLTEEYTRLGFSPAAAEEEARREIRLTTGDPYFGRTDDELAEMRRVEADALELVRRSAGITDEFPAGEFAVPGFNC